MNLTGCENGCGNEQPTPGMSFIEFDINKHTTDILGLYRYLAAKVYRNVQMTSDEGLHAAILEPSPQGAMEKLLNFFGQDMVQLDPQQLQQSFSLGSEVPVLGFDEMVFTTFYFRLMVSFHFLVFIDLRF